jgi:anthranilate 1,2-dioxygenase small subunit
VIEELYREYVDLLDEGTLEKWPALFAEDAVYRVVSRENVERDWPLSLILCEGRAAIEDRVWAILNASFFVPRSLRHLVGPLRIVGEGSASWRVTTNYAVFESLAGELPAVFSVGRYRDRVVQERDGRLRFAEKICICDSALVRTSLIVPL